MAWVRSDHGMASFRPWYGFVQTMVWLPSDHDMASFRPWNGCLQTIVWLPSEHGMDFFRAWYGFLQTMVWLPSDHGTASFRPEGSRCRGSSNHGMVFSPFLWKLFEGKEGRPGRRSVTKASLRPWHGLDPGRVPAGSHKGTPSEAAPIRARPRPRTQTRIGTPSKNVPSRPAAGPV